MRSRRTRPAVEKTAPAAGCKAVIYPTCFVNYNNPGIGEAAQAVLARNGVETEVIYPQCCGMPQLEAGDLAKVAGAARHVAATLVRYIDQGKEGLAPGLQPLGGAVTLHIACHARAQNTPLLSWGAPSRAAAEARARGKPDPTPKNTSPEGRASSVLFIRFRFTPEEIAAFKAPGAHILVGFDHPGYAHMARLPEPIRAALAEDFD
jgi:Cysteine-rich domain